MEACIVIIFCAAIGLGVVIGKAIPPDTFKLPDGRECVLLKGELMCKLNPQKDSK